MGTEIELVFGFQFPEAEVLSCNGELSDWFECQQVTVGHAKREALLCVCTYNTWQKLRQSWCWFSLLFWSMSAGGERRSWGPFLESLNQRLQKRNFRGRFSRRTWLSLAAQSHLLPAPGLSTMKILPEILFSRAISTRWWGHEFRVARDLKIASHTYFL